MSSFGARRASARAAPVSLSLASAVHADRLKNREVLEVLQHFRMLGLETSPQVQTRAESGQLVVYDRAEVKHFRRDGHEWKKKKSSPNSCSCDLIVPCPVAPSPNSLWLGAPGAPPHLQTARCWVSQRSRPFWAWCVHVRLGCLRHPRAGRDGKTVREDHEKLKIDSIERLTCCYAHSEEMPTFHRRIYWLLQPAAAKPAPTLPAADDAGGAAAPASGAAVPAAGAAATVVKAEGCTGSGGDEGEAPVQATACAMGAGAPGGAGDVSSTAAAGGAAYVANANVVLVHYLDERNIVSDPSDPSSNSKGARASSSQRRGAAKSAQAAKGKEGGQLLPPHALAPHAFAGAAAPPFVSCKLKADKEEDTFSGGSPTVQVPARPMPHARARRLPAALAPPPAPPPARVHVHVVGRCGTPCATG